MCKNSLDAGWTPFSAKYTSAPGLPAVYILLPSRPLLFPASPPLPLTHQSSKSPRFSPPRRPRQIFARDSLYIFSHEPLFCVFSFLSRFYSRFPVWYLASGGRETNLYGERSGTLIRLTEKRSIILNDVDITFQRANIKNMTAYWQCLYCYYF